MRRVERLFANLGMIFVLLSGGSVWSACKSVSSGEKKRVFEKILGVDELEVEGSEQLGESPVAVATPAPTPSSSPVVAATPAPTPSSSPVVAATPAPTNLRAAPRLPFPRGVNHSDLLQFINAHADVAQVYQPLFKEWTIYSRFFSESANATDVELAGLKVRVKEDFARAHWLFSWGMLQTSFGLLGKGVESGFLIDRQEDFLEKMSVLLFLATELQSASGRPEYRETLKKFYKNVNAKFFKRPLTDRPPKPEGVLRPGSSPQLPRLPVDED
ncbi:MAG: hypothetical protein ACO3A4_01965 [Silvanigrellaceae bacterium]